MNGAEIESSKEPRRIVIIDDHPLIRRGLKSFIESHSNLEVCAEVAGPKPALLEIFTPNPALVIIGVSMRNGDGLAVIASIRAHDKHLPILVFAAHESPEQNRRTLAVGASGLINMKESDETLLDSIRDILKDENF